MLVACPWNSLPLGNDSVPHGLFPALPRGEDIAVRCPIGIPTLCCGELLVRILEFTVTVVLP